MPNITARAAIAAAVRHGSLLYGGKTQKMRVSFASGWSIEGTFGIIEPNPRNGITKEYDLAGSVLYRDDFVIAILPKDGKVIFVDPDAVVACSVFASES